MNIITAFLFVGTILNPIEDEDLDCQQTLVDNQELFGEISFEEEEEMLIDLSGFSDFSDE